MNLLGKNLLEIQPSLNKSPQLMPQSSVLQINVATFDHPQMLNNLMFGPNPQSAMNATSILPATSTSPTILPGINSPNLWPLPSMASPFFDWPKSWINSFQNGEPLRVENKSWKKDENIEGNEEVKLPSEMMEQKSKSKVEMAMAMHKIKAKSPSKRRVRLTSPKMRIPTHCVVCGRLSMYNYYGVKCCESCKQFFRRAIIRQTQFACPKKRQCHVDGCRSCRMDKCLLEGMNPKLIGVSDSDLGSRIKFLIKVERQRTILLQLNAQKNGMGMQPGG